MLNLKLSVFVASLIAAAVVGGVGSSIVLNVFSPEPKPVACEPAPAPGKNTLRHVDPVNTGRDKGY
ncbi:hypothetical protein AB0V82_20430 [Escherichia coli]|nr:hypothetical protein [Salmonella enterica]EEO5288285.1 hypothetical protein [Salmonella enterica]EES2010842.1 hypothetical protein [Escherichia coli]HEK7473292.1 hypothetical protein [Escherichia coli]HEK7605517.1 hypothetical protein [Escherichia coli]